MITMKLTPLYSQSHKIFDLSSTAESGVHQIYQLLTFLYSDLKNPYKYTENNHHLCPVQLSNCFISPNFICKGGNTVLFRDTNCSAIIFFSQHQVDLLLASPVWSSDLLYFCCPSFKETMGISCSHFVVQTRNSPSLNLYISPLVVFVFDMLQYTFYRIVFFLKGCRMTNRY